MEVASNQRKRTPVSFSQVNPVQQKAGRSMVPPTFQLQSGSGPQHAQGTANQASPAVFQLKSGKPAEKAEQAAPETRPDSDVDHIEFSLEEVLAYEAEQSMAEDVQMQTKTQDLLYINQPGFIGGMGYNAAKMKSIFNPLKAGRTKVAPFFKAMVKDPENQEKKQAFEQAMQNFEATDGLIARMNARDAWLEPQVRPDLIEALLNDVAAIGTELKVVSAALFDPEQTNPKSLAITGARSLYGKIDRITSRIKNALRFLKGHKGWGKTVGTKQRNQLIRALTGLRTRLNQTNSLIKPRKKKVAEKNLNQKQTSQYASKVNAALSQKDKALEIIQSFTEDQKSKIEAHNEQWKGRNALAAAVMDPDQVPALIPSKRTTATVKIGDSSLRFWNHSESRMAYFKDAYNITSRNINLPGKPQTPPAAGEAGKKGDAENKAEKESKKFKNRQVQRLYDVHKLLSDRGFSSSEAKIIATVSSGEGNFETTQALDRVRFSWGLIQFQGHTLMHTIKHLKKNDPDFFYQNFERYGIYVGGKGQVAPKSSGRNERSVPGDQWGKKSSEANGVNDLVVYDHAGGTWVHGNEGLEVIQKDPRYQALFAIAGATDEGRFAQMTTARENYLQPARDRVILTTGKGKDKKRFKVKDVFKSETAMFPLFDRKVHHGNVKFASGVLKAYLAKKKIKLKDFDPADLSQADFAAFLKGYKGGNMNNVRWNLLKNLSASGLGDLSDSSYSGK